MEEDRYAIDPSDASQGAFFNSLKRNNKQIRDDRATAITEDTELVYKRKIEDLEKEIALGIKIRNTEITLEIARQRYQYLFGGA